MVKGIVAKTNRVKSSKPAAAAMTEEAHQLWGGGRKRLIEDMATNMSSQIRSAIHRSDIRWGTGPVPRP